MVFTHEQTFRACADRTRLRILALLSGGEVCVGDLVTILELPQPTVSRHLAYLRRARLVEVARDGNWIFYRLASPTSGFQRQLLACLRCSAEEDALMRKDGRRLARLRIKGGCCVRSGQACGVSGDRRTPTYVE